RLGQLLQLLDEVEDGLARGIEAVGPGAVGLLEDLGVLDLQAEIVELEFRVTAAQLGEGLLLGGQQGLAVGALRLQFREFGIAFSELSIARGKLGVTLGKLRIALGELAPQVLVLGSQESEVEGVIHDACSIAAWASLGKTIMPKKIS